MVQMWKNHAESCCGAQIGHFSLPLMSFVLLKFIKLMVPEVLTVENPSSLGKRLFDTDIKQLNEAYARGRQLTCNICREKGALVGCCSSSCHLVFHLPCAIRSNCFLDYEEFRCYCEKHSESAFKRTTAAYFSCLEKLPKNDEYDLCCLCMDRVDRQMKMHSVVQIACCGLRFYH
ncbi:hypothetical protein ANCCAN_27691, partial [Ancylostoma caninum]